MKTTSIQPMKRLPFLSALPITLFLVGTATAGPKELGAFVKGVWNPTVVPQVSIVLFRWGASGVQTLTTSEDRMLGQVASRGQRRIEIVMRTPPNKPSPAAKTGNIPPSYEVRLRCGVQICGDGIVVPCGECPFSRKYNGDSLVSRGAYTSNICCFDATFERVKGVDNLHIVDVMADGESVPYMIKFNVKPTIMRSGTKVPIPAGSRLHGASVSFQKLEDEPEGEVEPQNSSTRLSSPDDWKDNSEEPRAQNTEVWAGGVYAESPSFTVSQNGESVTAKFRFQVPEGGGRADLTVEGPGFRLKSASDLRTFAEGLKASHVAWQKAERSKKTSDIHGVGGGILSEVKFPRMEIPHREFSFYANRNDTRQTAVDWDEVSVRAVIVSQWVSGRTVHGFVRLEAMSSRRETWQELFTCHASRIPSILQCLAPPPTIRNALR